MSLAPSIWIFRKSFLQGFHLLKVHLSIITTFTIHNVGIGEFSFGNKISAFRNIVTIFFAFSNVTIALFFLLTIFKMSTFFFPPNVLLTFIHWIQLTLPTLQFFILIWASDLYFTLFVTVKQTVHIWTMEHNLFSFYTKWWHCMSDRRLRCITGIRFKTKQSNNKALLIFLS